MEQNDQGRRLVLGFDAGCMTCSEVARRVEGQVGGQLEVRDLRDPDVTHWIEEALGQDVRWGPTLIELSGDKIKAWTGLRMGFALSRRLGVRNTWRVIKVMSEFEGPDQVSTPAGPSFNRARFLKHLGGVTFALSVLSGTDLFARIANATEWVHPLNRKRVVSSKTLKGGALRRAVSEAQASEDVQNVWPDGFPDEDQIVGARYAYTDGNTVVSISWVVDDQLLIYYLPTRAIGNYRSQAMRIKVIPEEAFVLKATSVNGRLRPLDSAEAAGPADVTGRCRHCKRWRWGCVAAWANGCAACTSGQCVACAARSIPKCVLCLSCLLVVCGYGASACCKRWR